MLGLGRIWKHFSGRHYRKFVKSCQPIISKIHGWEEKLKSLNDKDLAAKTKEFRERIEQGEKLDNLLPEAFAVVRDAARRLVGTEFTICGQPAVWDMVHFDVQLIGGIALHQRKIAEMATGEGKTLMATLPLYLNALSGRNCHIITVNDYLARRDAEWMGLLFNFLQLTVGCIQNSMTPAERKIAYGCDITYGTASEFGFDYLRDNGLAMRSEDQVQRDHFYCIVDEIDSVLVDEARTPLIISGPIEEEHVAPYRQLQPQIARLVQLQEQLCSRWIAEAREKLQKNTQDKSAIERLFQVHMGMPKHRQLLKLLEDSRIQKQLERLETELSSELRRDEKFQLKEALYFVIEERQNSADLTERGRQVLFPENPAAFVLPDLPMLFSEIERRTDWNEEEKGREKGQLEARAAKIGEEIHCISQLLKAYALFERDHHYIVADGQIIIVDTNTGRAMPGRRWNEGLHQAVEAKEGLEIQPENKTFATITIQNYFRLYEKLAGMTGTAETEAQEFHDIYKLTVVVIPTNKPCRRIDDNDVIYKTRREKYLSVLQEVQEAHKKGQPVLVGTTSVESSEVLSKMFQHNNLHHSVLNAKYHQTEANIIAKAGQRGAITIATNMAGRGTDIKLGEGINEIGGLRVLGTERHESRRIDRQLRGRCARQGDNGSSKFFISLEDDLMRLFASRGPIAAILDRTFHEGDVLTHPLLNRSIANAQKKVEQQNYAIRKRLLEYDDVLNRQREVIYTLRNEALRSSDPSQLLFDLIEEEILEMMESKDDQDETALAQLVSELNYRFPLHLTVDELKELEPHNRPNHVFSRLKTAYQTKQQVEDREILAQIERFTIIQALDYHWQNHLSAMDDLRHSIGLRSYGQKNPLYEYKTEAFKEFSNLLKAVRKQISFALFRSASTVDNLRLVLQKLENRDQKEPSTPPLMAEPVSLKISMPNIGRNDSCPCGSGKKYKKCCGK